MGHKLDTWRLWQLIAMVVISVTVVLVAVVLVVHYSLSSSAAACDAANHVNKELSQFLTAQQHRIGQKGTATATYYHDHPQFLKDAKDAYTQLLKALKPAKC